jgi:XTP/dITP diphosphohydrolase
MEIVLATGNRGKVREIQQLCSEEVFTYSELVEAFEIIEDGDTFASNALIKAKAVYDKLPTKEHTIVIADDSGISVEALGGEPGIYSARFAGENATDKENLEALIQALKERGLQQSSAHYTAAIAIVSHLGEYVVHGWMYGHVTTEVKGDKGFGYDPVFIPYGYRETLGELEGGVKQAFSHRAKALRLAKPIIEMMRGKL